MPSSKKEAFAANLTRAALANDAVCRPRSIDLTALAEATGIGRSTLSCYANGRLMPGTDNLVKLAAGLGVSVDELLAGV